MDQTSRLLVNVVPFIVLIAVMYFLLIRPQKKKDKEIAAMRAALRSGDQIVTIGGLCGRVVRVKDDTVVIQLTGDRVKIEVMKWAISTVVNTTAKKEEPGSKRPKKLKKDEADGVVDVVTEDIQEEKKAEPADAEPAAEAETAEKDAASEEK